MQMLHLDIMPKATTINSATLKILTKFHAYLCHDKPHSNMADVLLQHNNAWLHVSLWTKEAIRKFIWIVLPHPP